MRLSFDWLCDYANFSALPFETILEKISLSICEVDKVEEYREDLNKVQIVKILEKETHPSSDKLFLYKVTNGQVTHTVVSNLSHLVVNQTLALALPGANIKNKLILESEIRGIKSYGMFVSEQDLGLSEKEDAFLLSESAPLGESLRKYLRLEDKILVIDNKSITHRPDLWSHFGFARELASQLHLPITFNPFTRKVNFQKNEKLKVHVTQHAHSYYACYITGIEVKESNPKIKARLEKCGIRSISNVVDVSNYVMLEMGQPTHFFDADTLENLELSVEKGFSSSFACLDEVTRTLNENIVVIVNNNKPIAIAGIMGGKETEVSLKTKNLVLESAVFKREDIRKGSRSLEIRSEASIRYEKGLERTTVLPVTHRTIELLKENGCSNLIAFEPTGFIHDSERVVKIFTNFDFINRKIGKIFPKSEILSILERLGFVVHEKGKDLEIQVPNYRHNYDVTIPEDIVEEIGRSLGYANVDAIPLNMEVLPTTLQESRKLERRVKEILAYSLGFQEVYNYSFASPREIDFEKNSSKALKILNPMPEESSYLRTSTYPSILHSLKKNIDRFEIISLFEFGRVYFRSEKELGNEKKFFTILHYSNHKESFSEVENLFLEFRDKLYTLLDRLNLKHYASQKNLLDYFHPNASLEISFNGKKIIELGILHPKLQKEYEFKKKVFLARIEFENLLETYLSQKQVFHFKAPSVFPAAFIDISLILENQASTETYVNLVQNTKIPEIQAAYVSSIYRGSEIPENKKSVTYRFELLNYESSFTQKQIHEITEKLVEIAKENGFALR